MQTIEPSRLLRTVLLVDAVVSAGVAALQLFAGPLLAGLLALPAMLLLESGIFLVAYVARLLAMARSARLWSWLVRVVIVGNVAWAAGCVGLPLLLATPPSAPGVAFLLLQAAAVLAFAALQWRGLRQSPPAPAGLTAARF